MICILCQGLSIKLYFYYIYWNTLNWIYMYVWKVTFEIQLTPLQEPIPNSIRVVATIGESNGNPLQSSCLENPTDRGAWWAAVHGVTKIWTRLRNFTFPFHFQALEKEMATHSSVVAWRIPGMGEPGGLPSVGLHRVRHDWSDSAAAANSMWQGHDSLTFSGKPSAGTCCDLVPDWVCCGTTRVWGQG